jgi:hypothetical protein
MSQLKHDISPNFIWFDDSATEFQCALSSDKFAQGYSPTQVHNQPHWHH